MRQTIVAAAALLISSAGAAAAQTAPADPAVQPGSTTSPTGYTPEGKLATDTDAPTVAMADVHLGMRVADKENRKIGKVSAVDAEGVTVDYGGGTTKVPYGAFGKDGPGLTMKLTRADFIKKAQHPQ